MSSKKIALIVEGDGEVTAVPALIGRVLQHVECFDVFPHTTAINAHGGGNLTCTRGLERFLELAYRSADSAAVLVMIDSEGDCPKEMAERFAARIRAHGARKPTAVVVANHMYEVWFVACASALRGVVSGSRTLSDDIDIPQDPEGVRDPKAWIQNKMKPRQYKETEDQLVLTRKIDFSLAQTHSRSFRRLLHAVQQLTEAIEANDTVVTP